MYNNNSLLTKFLLVSAFNTYSKYLVSNNVNRFIFPFIGKDYFLRFGLHFLQSSFIKDDVIFNFPFIKDDTYNGYYFLSMMRNTIVGNRRFMADTELSYKQFIKIFETSDKQGEGFYKTTFFPLRKSQYPFVYTVNSNLFSNFGDHLFFDQRFFLNVVRGLGRTINANNFLLLKRCLFFGENFTLLLNPFFKKFTTGLTNIVIPSLLSNGILLKNTKKLKKGKVFKYFSFFNFSKDKPSLSLNTSFPILINNMNLYSYASINTKVFNYFLIDKEKNHLLFFINII